MISLVVLFYEWKHFTRSTFKIIALLLYLLAGIYGLHKGARLHDKQLAAINQLEHKAEKERLANVMRYENNKLVPDDRDWVNLSEPNWAIEAAEVYHHKMPSPAMVYSIGQSEQYGYSKKITTWSSPYDVDLAEEIANPERLQIGTLDFSFALLFLAPLLLLVFLYNIKSTEVEQGFMTLVEVQSTAKNRWLSSRVLFYFLLLLSANLLMLLYGALLTGILALDSKPFLEMTFYSSAYCAFWFVLYFIVLLKGKSSLGNALWMIGLYFTFAFIIPATVYQCLSIQHPTNLMTDLADAKVEKRWQIWDKSDSTRLIELTKLYPEIANSAIRNDEEKSSTAITESTAALENLLRKASIQPIERENELKNDFISSTYWFNPVTFFQNKFNAISQNHYDNYQTYRHEIQYLVDKQVNLLVREMWKDVGVDKQRYLWYTETLSRVDSKKFLSGNRSDR